jgi:malate dehydrogenase (oxaloacetate-decarboxylating)
LLAALQTTGLSITDQNICIFGAGSAGCGIANLLLRTMIESGLPELDARRHIFMIDANGLLVEGMSDLSPTQLPFVVSQADVLGWAGISDGRIGLQNRLQY